MTDVIASLFVDVHLSEAELSSFCDANCSLVASTVSSYYLRQTVLRVVADGTTKSSRKALFDCHRSSLI